MERKLAAILSADVKGYSRLMGEDEEATVQTLTAYRQVFADAVQRHNGRIVDMPGDNVLADFTSVVDAVRSAVEIQSDLRSRNAQLPPSRRMEFRIGLNLGDVLADGPRIYGDGVNVAARLEALAEPGGILLSGAAFEQVEAKLPLVFDFVGEHAVKNIARPVRAYRVRLDDRVGTPSPPPARPDRRRLRRLVAVPAGVVAVLSLLVAGYVLLPRPWKGNGEVPSVTPATFEQDKPSMVVLPFKSLGSAAEDDYLSEGITNDLITDLSKLPGLVVIASSTAFAYKGKPVDPKQIGRDLDVRYVLDGTVQSAAERVRVNVQLVDTATGRHVWAERYDRPARELLSLQSEIIETITNHLAVKIAEAERQRILRRDTRNPRAYDIALRGFQLLEKRQRTSTHEARRLFLSATQEDPDYASAWVGLARTYLWDFLFGWTEFPDQALRQAEDLARRAVSLNSANAGAHVVLGMIRERQSRFDEAMHEYQLALSFQPSDALAHTRMGVASLYAGRISEALSWLQAAHRLDPHGSAADAMHLGMALYLQGRFAEAITVLDRGVSEHPGFVGLQVILAAAYARLGEMPAARSTAREVRRLEPFFTLKDYGSQFQNPAHRAALVDALRMAGLE